MTAATLSGPMSQSHLVRVRALPACSNRSRPIAPASVPAAALEPSLATTGLRAATAAQASASHASEIRLAAHRSARAAAKPKRHEAIEFRMIFSIAFAFFLLTSVLERALPHKWAARGGAGEERKSVVEQAREAAHISAGYAFMG